MDELELGRIGVLLGGVSSEREISLKSGKAVYEALISAGLDAVAIDISTEDPEENKNLIRGKDIDCAFLALHGRFGEDGGIQKILEEIRLPFTGSSAAASQLAMDKSASRGIFSQNGLNVPKFTLVRKDGRAGQYPDSNLNYPLVVKPVTGGSSIGLSIIEDRTGLAKALDLAFIYDSSVMIDEYITGRELTVGVLDDTALPVIEIIQKNRFFDFEAKYQSGMTEYVVPANLDSVSNRKVQEAGLNAHKFLGCSGCSRTDIILTRDGLPYVLEVNTIPGMTATSLLPKACRSIGIDFTQLCITLIKLAYVNPAPSEV